MAPKNWDDEEESSDEEQTTGAVRVAAKKKWDDEESDDEVLDSWDAADDSEEERKKEAKRTATAEKAAAEALANKKSKAERIEEQQKERAASKAAEAAAKAEIENETPKQRREREQARQLEGDMKAAEDLFGAVGIGAGSGGTGRVKPIAIVDPADQTKSLDLASMQIFNPTTKDNFTQLKDILVPLLGKHSKKPHYPTFLPELVRGLAKDMSSEQVRKIASAMTTLANEKQKEEKAAEKGGKKKGAKPKANLAAAGKEADRVDTRTYDNDYDDFDDFM